MPDLLTTPVQTEEVSDLETRLRVVYHDLPHEFKAEIVDGGILLTSPGGEQHGTAAGNIYFGLRMYQRSGAQGRAYPDDVGYRVHLVGRGSFSPDVSFYSGSYRGTGFIEDAPTLALEIRSPDDYGPRAEERLARKRDDYFAAGTKVVWDVAPRAPATVGVYRADRPETPDVFRRGETADAEPAAPGWRFAVDEPFD